MRIATFALLIILALSSACHNPFGNESANSMYADSSLWYQTGRQIDNNLPDVFYILPTCIFDWSDSLGVTQHHALPSMPKHRRKMEPSYQLADQIFGDSANFFAPYYRQITLDSWFYDEDVVNERFVLSFSDIVKAFGYYINNLNNGRPFILAGFSQGGKGVVELLKIMPADMRKKMIAAYVIGYKVTADDIESCDNFYPAQSEFDTGVTVVYNTVADTSTICKLVSYGGKYVINPASWSTDTLWHRLNDSVSLRLDLEKNVVVAKGLTPSLYYVKSLDILFKEGNLHLQELYLYKDVLQKNVKTRAKSFSRGNFK